MLMATAHEHPENGWERRLAPGYGRLNDAVREAMAMPAPSEAIAALAANTPCKWRPVPIEALAPMPGVGRQTHVRIGATVQQLRQAPWAIRPDTR